MRRLTCLIAAALCAAAAALAANTVTRVSQVEGDVTVGPATDYVITSATPFAEGGRIDLAEGEGSVIIVRQVRPSQVISQWLRGHVYVGGAQAVDGSNCQVKMYGPGTVIMPYGRGFRPLTVYSEQHFGGMAADAFGLEHTGGYMNTLTEAQLNNRIRSFRLRRGYMVTFSTRAGGRGYSRCFIADSEDLEVATLPAVLDGKISSYRVFRWQDAAKKGLASDTRADANAMLGSAWCYDWGTGVDRLPDAECVPNHIYEDWPSAPAIGSVTWACHSKNNNEPGNPADDRPQDVATVLANWENLMRTGLRLCSETSHDGSMAHLKAFCDSIDARGWRCDVLDLHCYWPAQRFDNWRYYYDTYGGRPIWISEWVWGASWNRDGVFGLGIDESDPTQVRQAQQRNAEVLGSIVPLMEQSPYVERYAYWNSERELSRLIVGGELTAAGRYYASVESGLAYDRRYEKVPTPPRQYNPGPLAATYDRAARAVRLTWHERNGEYNQSMEVQERRPGQSVWRTVATVGQQEDEADYALSTDGADGYAYRIRIVDLMGRERLSNATTAVSDHIEAGDAVTVGDGQMYVGGNMLVNGSFDLGLTDWLSGAGEPLGAPYFQAVPIGGIDGGAYLQCYGGGDQPSASTLRKQLALERGASYYVMASGCHADPARQRIATTPLASIEANVRLSLPAVDEWSRQGAAFTVTVDTALLITMRGLQGRAQIDDIRVCRLFASRPEAMADARTWALARAGAFCAYNTRRPELNDSLSALCASDADANAIEAAVQAYAARLHAAEADTAQGYQLLTGAVANPSFADGSASWSVRTGSYTGGDQRTSTQAGRTCWNAWWSTPAEGGRSTSMSIEQGVAGLAHGLYALECKAATQHYCESDQHGWLRVGEAEAVTPVLPLGCLDLPAVAEADRWQTLVTPYVYLADGETLRVGFTGTKEGALDGAYMPYGSPDAQGDHREGWWCATDFYLRHIPQYRCTTDASGWGTVCLPYAIAPGEGVRLYRLAGILSDQSAIALDEVTSTEPGAPYVYRVAGPGREVTFAESGRRATVAQTNVGGLRGAFTTTARYPVGSLVLVGGRWNYIADAADRYTIADYSGYVQRVTNLTVLDQWTGLTLPVDGLASSLGAVRPDAPADGPTYNALGQRVAPGASGLVIRQGQKRVQP